MVDFGFCGSGTNPLKLANISATFLRSVPGVSGGVESDLSVDFSVLALLNKVNICPPP